MLGDHLADPVDLYLRASFTMKSTYGPNFVRLAVGAGWLKAVLAHSVAVSETGMTKGIADEKPTLIDEDCNELSDLEWSLEIDAAYLRVVGACPSGGQSESPWLACRELVHSIVALRTGRIFELDQVGTFGGALFFDGEDDAVELISFVREHVPEVVARQTQMDMANQIRSSLTSAASTTSPAAELPGDPAGGPGGPGATPATRRRPGL